MSKYKDELAYKLIIIDQEIKEKQETLDFTNNFLETCIVPFPNLDKDKKISEELGAKMEVKRNQIEEYKLFSEQKKASRTPFQLWKDLFGAHPILKVASIFFGLHLILVMFASILRDLFYDQFIVLMVIGQMFIFVHFNILWSFKLAADAFWLYFYFGHWWDSDYLDGHSLAYIRYLVLLSTIALFIVRFVLMWLIVKLGFLRMKDDDADLNAFAPNIQDVRIDPDFSQSDIQFSKADHF